MVVVVNDVRAEFRGEGRRTNSKMIQVYHFRIWKGVPISDWISKTVTLALTLYLKQIEIEQRRV